MRKIRNRRAIKIPKVVDHNDHNVVEEGIVNETCNNATYLLTPYAQNVWDSDMKIVSKLSLLIPRKILKICNKIQSSLPGMEFSILVRGEWDEGGFLLSEDYVIPRQEVGAASVDYKEDLSSYKQLGYNTVIHSHPFASSSFSHSDKESINAHFDCSVLYSQKNFTTASIKVQISPSVQLQIKPEIDIIDEDIEEIDISNIERKPCVTVCKDYQKDINLDPFGYYGGIY